jgi:hypothetical protein
MNRDKNNRCLNNYYNKHINNINNIKNNKNNNKYIYNNNLKSKCYKD